MRIYYYLLLILSFSSALELGAQNQRYIVKRAPFSSGLNDEFSPVYYNGGIVFCSTLRDNSLIGYKDEHNRLYKIVYVGKKDSMGWKGPKLFSKELTSDFNDGPATFNSKGNIIYYSRNNSIVNYLRNINDTSNKLGIYNAELINGIWTNIKPFKNNNPLYSFCTPSLAPNGKRIYFSSDMPGGYGEMDLYYCDSLKDGWSQPKNLGPVINTPKNESFPFAGKYYKLFFTSDGHEGFGGKDLFYSQEINGKWIDPVHLDSAINSPADDFGLVTDSTFEKGYFSSNRLKKDDIFSFSSAPVEFKSCDSLRENNYCFTFFDERRQLIDNLPVTYLWDFGNEIKMTGTEVKHCFPGPGEYSVKLIILDELTGDTIAKQIEYKVNLKDFEQAYIDSYNVGIVDKSMSFDGVKTNLKDFHITDYLWNFGDGFKPGGLYMNQTFSRKGVYSIRLGILGAKDSLGIIPGKCVTKKIEIFGSYQELESKGEGKHDAFTEKADSAGLQIKTLQIRIIFMDDLMERQKAKIKAALGDAYMPVVNFSNTGILPPSFSVLDKIAEVLNSNPDIRVEIAVHTANNEMRGDSVEPSERWAQELAFFFRNKGIKKDSFRSNAFGSGFSILKPAAIESKAIEGTVEFIFMKKK